jgi:hypothetical protein
MSDPQVVAVIKSCYRLTRQKLKISQRHFSRTLLRLRFCCVDNECKNLTISHVTDEWPGPKFKMIGDEGGIQYVNHLQKEVTSPPEGSTGLKKFKSPFGIVCVEFF